MRNAQKAALMAMFAAMEERSEEPVHQHRNVPPPEPKTDRPILVDLAALAHMRALGGRKA